MDIRNEQEHSDRPGLIFGKKGTLIGFFIMLIFGLILYFSGGF